MKDFKILVASDHRGFELKSQLQEHLQNYTWVDLGPSSSERVDYPDFAERLCLKLKDQPDFKGLLICGSGQGMAIRANRFSYIRAALCWDTEMARLARAHNDANVLCLGADWIPEFSQAKGILEVFLETEFEGGRHQTRVDKLSCP